MQHGQKLKDNVQNVMVYLGFDLKITNQEAHLCCGSAGTYSVLNPEIANNLKSRKLGHLESLKPKAILSANIGCITQLQSGTELPVNHWIELIDDCLG